MTEAPEESISSTPARAASDMAKLYSAGRQKYCFACGNQVDVGLDLSAEHIIPQWIIRQAELTKGGMQLPNFEQGTSLRSFLRSKVDCCISCNNALSKSLEPEAKEILGVERQGNLRPAHRRLMLLWLAKIYYANSFAGMSFAADPRQMNNIAHVKLTNQAQHISILDNIQSHLFNFIENPRFSVTEDLGSIFTFRCLPTPKPDFYYSDGHQQMPVVIFRYKSLGIVAYFAGGNQAERMFDRRTLAWTCGPNPYDLDVGHLKYAKTTRLVNEQLLDVASIIAQLGTAYFNGSS
ncbi:hypothetical protein PTW37_03570 [Arthrobacter agilis]|uniref:hypothetical protein n=1 Tax=Arthrobacter agilis TaxID=37921 RepID=UPI002365F7B5|nr:hypothetical protein [Arthrobacter agilis]WDF34018.1 hypothetical protein PTW37_03570 [Arthrobacter agilis]